MALYSAMLDACVIVPVSICDTHLRLAERLLFRPIWSARILDEARGAVLGWLRIRLHVNVRELRPAGAEDAARVTGDAAPLSRARVYSRRDVGGAQRADIPGAARPGVPWRAR